MLVQDDVHLLKQTPTIVERVAKIINAKDRLIALDLFKATTKVTTETIVAVIVAATNKQTVNYEKDQPLAGLFYPIFK
jgi:chaperone required for assembly of F1-ATPase